MAYQFFVTGSDENLALSADDFFHLTKVLRVRIGEELELVSDRFRYFVNVTSLNPFTYHIRAKKELVATTLPAITLLYALPKGDKLDFVIQKAVEIGVAAIILVESAHCVTRFSHDKKDQKLLRYQKIIKSAAMQSKQDRIPTLSGPFPFHDVITFRFDRSLIAHEKATVPLRLALTDFPQLTSISVLIGPEGGFSAEEVRAARLHGYHAISFGANVLRSETAAIYALSILHHYKEGINDENL